jgi:hypothetical protein
MNRRGFLWAAVAAGLALVGRDPGRAQALSDREENPEALIRAALHEHRILEFHYHGHARRAEPHALGRAKDNRPALLAWQAAGSSRSEPPPGWRTFLLAEIEHARTAPETFSPRPDYRPEKTRLKEILAEVAP